QGKGGQAGGGLDGVGADGGQVGEQATQAVHRLAVVGDLGGDLGQRRGRAAGGRDRAGPQRAAGGGVVVLEQDRGEFVLHVPGDVVGEQPDQHVGAHPAGEPVPDRPDEQVGVQ